MPFVRRRQGQPHCWDQQRAEYFDSLLTTEQCEVNWLEGAMGGEHDRPQFNAPEAPALFGFDNTIWDYCTQVSPQASMENDDWNKELARRCVAANLNILRILVFCPNCFGSRVGWNLCRNLEFVVCSARGLLPGQGASRSIKFALAPQGLDIRDMENPGRLRGQWWQEPHAVHYAVSDVYFAEVCILSELCRNSEEIFHVGRGERFVCDFQEGRYRALVQALMNGPA
jgi:hypothetical protein